MASRTIQTLDGDILDRLFSIRQSLHGLLEEVETRLRPVQIDAENGIDFYEIVARFERQLIVSALEVTRGNQRRAASLLRIGTTTLSSKMKQLNLR